MGHEHAVHEAGSGGAGVLAAAAAGCASGPS